MTVSFVIQAYCFVAAIGEADALRGAVPKFTLKRLHQMVTARYLARSRSAGRSY
jgi:hypothetical protein